MALRCAHPPHTWIAARLPCSCLLVSTAEQVPYRVTGGPNCARVVALASHGERRALPHSCTPACVHACMPACLHDRAPSAPWGRSPVPPRAAFARVRLVTLPTRGTAPLPTESH